MRCSHGSNQQTNIPVPRMLVCSPLMGEPIETASGIVVNVDLLISVSAITAKSDRIDAR